MGVLNMSDLLRFILRPSVITVIMICQLNIVQSSQPCVVTKKNTEGGEIEVLGEIKEFCHLQMINRSSVVVLETPSTTSPFYLYVKREDTDHCSNGSYAMINGQAESCYAVFTMFIQNRLQLNLRGNVSVNLKEIHSMDQSIPVYSGCTDSGQDFTENINVSSNVKCKVEWYKQVISCEDAVNCQLSVPDNCNASLGYREVELKCAENEEENQKILLVYPDVTFLDLRGNNIVNIDSLTFHELSNLKIISVGRNRLQQLPIGIFDKLGDLNIVDISFNRLKSIDNGIFVNLKKLVQLYANRNHIKTIESGSFHNLAKLTFLNLEFNMLTSLSTDTFQGLHSLKLLYLNGIQQATTLSRGFFQNLTRLTFLYFGNNTIMTIETESFKTLGELEVLFLERNALTHLYSGIFAGMGNLEILSVSINRLKWIDPDVFHPLPKLISLDLGNNALMELNTKLISGDLSIWRGYF